MIDGKASILLIEGKRAERPSFFVGLTRKGFAVQVVSSGNAALEALETRLPETILVDAASMRTSGKRICQSLHRKSPKTPVILIVDQNQTDVDKNDANVVLVHPFTLQKLLNRLRHLLPAEEKDLQQIGPLKLDAEQRWVRFQDKQVSLTPRLVMLLKALMDRPGEVIDRQELFRMVWETGYTGDTRTLDVHISWLRQAMEEDPRHPRFIKTVRGVGYRLDVESY